MILIRIHPIQNGGLHKCEVRTVTSSLEHFQVKSADRESLVISVSLPLCLYGDYPAQTLAIPIYHDLG